MQRKTIVGISVLFALLLLCVLGWWFRKDHQLENVRQLQAEAFSRENRELGDEQRRAKFQQFRDAYDKLSESQQRELRRDRSRGMQGRMTGKIRSYFEMPKSQRITFLDKQINEMEKRRREFSNRERGGERRGGGPLGAQRGNRNRANTSEADRKARRDRFKRGFLDNTTPQQRAEMAEYMEALRERREERGLPDLGRRRRYGLAIAAVQTWDPSIRSS